MSKAEYLEFAEVNGYERENGVLDVMRLRRAHAHGSKLSIVFVDGGLRKCMATIVSCMPHAYRDTEGDVLFLVDLRFDGDDPSDDGIQAVWLRDMVAQDDAPVEGKWALEGDQSLLETGCPRCRWGGCTRCRAP
jgi:hypothetical protein